VLRGRPFTTRDGSDAPRVAIVNRELARRYFPDVDPIGRRIAGGFEFVRGPREIVGVVDDVKYGSVDQESAPLVYVPESQMAYPFLSVVVRSRQPADAVIAWMHRALREVDASVPLSDVRRLDSIKADSLAPHWFGLVLIGTFAAAAMVLSVLGLYGILALGVRQRRRELGVRLALGARPADLRRLVLGEGVATTALGLATGVALAFWVTRWLADLLYQVSASDPVVFIAATGIVFVVACAASYLPARHATRLEPSQTLRAD
jgi:ABC-type antimicrobial peptide transport system permease subunit